MPSMLLDGREKSDNARGMAVRLSEGDGVFPVSAWGCRAKKTAGRGKLITGSVVISKFDVIPVLIFVALYKVTCIPVVVQQGMKVAFIGICLLYIVSHAASKVLLNASIPFCCAVIVSSVYGWQTGSIALDNALDGLFYAVCLYSLTSIAISYAERGLFTRLIDVFFACSLMYSACSLVAMGIVGRSNLNDLLIYFCGNKFSTSYVFILTTALFYVKTAIKNNKFSTIRYVIYYILSICSIAVSYWLYCSTAVIAAAFLMLFPLFSATIRHCVTRPLAVVLFILISGGILLSLGYLMQLPFVQHVIVDILGEDLTLTGRIKIYESLYTVIEKSIVIGYGYGNEAVKAFVGYGNAQNGVFQLLVDYGLVGLGAFLLSVFYYVRNSDGVRYWGLFTICFCMIVAAIVEISFNYVFFIGLALIAASKYVANHDCPLR